MSSDPALNPGGTIDFSSSQSQGQVQRIGLVPAKDTDENTNINLIMLSFQSLLDADGVS